MINTLSLGTSASEIWARGMSAHGILTALRPKYFLAWLVLSLTTFDSAQSQDVAPPEVAPPAQEASAKLIDFDRDVRPIFESSCLECHGPKDAKEGFRVDEKDTLLSYVEPGDVSASSLWTDYLATADEEMKMPPVKANKPLTGAQLATIKLWIEEGAQWTAPAAAVAVAPPPAKTQFQLVTAFLGSFILPQSTSRLHYC